MKRGGERDAESVSVFGVNAKPFRKRSFQIFDSHFTTFIHVSPPNARRLCLNQAKVSPFPRTSASARLNFFTVGFFTPSIASLSTSQQRLDQLPSAPATSIVKISEATR